MTVPPSSVSIVALLGEELQHIAGALVGLTAEEIMIDDVVDETLQ